MNQLAETDASGEEKTGSVALLITEALHHAQHILPSQGPIEVFVHHNTLHALEDRPFSEAVQLGISLYGSQPYLSETRYRQEMESGRIQPDDLATVLRDDLGLSASTEVVSGHTRFDLQLAMLMAPIRSGPAAELSWLVDETDALRVFRNELSAGTAARMIDTTKRLVMRDYRGLEMTHSQRHDRGRASLEAGHDEWTSRVLHTLLQDFGVSRIESWSHQDWEAFTLHFLWRLCQHGAAMAGRPAVSEPDLARPRDYVIAAEGTDPDLLAHELLIRFSAAFLDQGFASWRLPNRDEGIYRCFLKLFSTKSLLGIGWLSRLETLVAEEAALGLTAMQSIERSLADLGVAGDSIERFIVRTMLALPGWAGMMWQMESNAAWTSRPAPPGSLQQFLAVRLLVDRAALAEVAEPLTGRQSSSRLYVTHLEPLIRYEQADWRLQRAFSLFQVAQLLGIGPVTLAAYDNQQWKRLVEEVEAFGPLARRRVFQLAYEYRYATAALDAISSRAEEGWTATVKPKFQVICCLDDREESFRRHLEEIEPGVETFGAAGFYAVAMYFRGLTEAHYRPLCPIVMKPQHYVAETTPLTFLESGRLRAGTRRVLGRASHTLHIGSRALIGGIVTALFGSIASIPLVARVLFPRLTARVRALFGRFVQPPPITKLQLERQKPEPGPDEGSIGFSLDEMVSIVERLMHDVGLLNLSPLVLVVGHGSSSLNNPHESAYNCGACGGGRGGPNARALAQMANDPRVRSRLRERGLAIPDSTVFVGAYHNTCADSFTYFDLERLTADQANTFTEAREVIDEARQRNAHERARRFQSAPLSLSPREALRHVEGRSEDLAQTRPEYNHATNAMCVVGRRGRTRGLFLDRRCFLTSYDPTIDDENRTILNRVLQAALPVCAGINLEYYFSCVDPAGYGAGSKLPHNITSLLGVMEGAASDLRPGLSVQMVDIHEPLRCLFVIETEPDAMLSIMQRNPGIDLLVRNEWVQVATLDPNSSRIHVYRHGRFEPYVAQDTQLPQVATSLEWYRGWRGHLGFARVLAATSFPHASA